MDTAGAAGAPCVLDGEDLRSIGDALCGRRLTAISALRVCAVGVSFAGAQLQGGRFDDADLRAADFTGADFEAPAFAGPTEACDFRSSRPAAAVAENGNTRAPDLTGADLGAGLFDKAKVQ